MVSAGLGPPCLGVMLNTEMDAIQLGGWERSKILVITVLPHKEIVFWTESTVTGSTTACALEDCRGTISGVGPVDLLQSEQRSGKAREAVGWEAVFTWKWQPTLSFAWAVPFLLEAVWSPGLDLILQLHVHIPSAPADPLAMSCHWLWSQPQCKLENRNHTCLDLHSIPSTGLSWLDGRTEQVGGVREAGAAEGRPRDAVWALIWSSALTRALPLKIAVGFFFGVSVRRELGLWATAGGSSRSLDYRLGPMEENQQWMEELARTLNFEFQ